MHLNLTLNPTLVPIAGRQASEILIQAGLTQIRMTEDQAAIIAQHINRLLLKTPCSTSSSSSPSSSLPPSRRG